MSTDAAERALLVLVSTGDRCAMDQLYIRYFARLANFFRNVTLRAEVVEELVNDTMLEVWKSRESIRSNVSVLLAIKGLAYARAQKYFAEVKPDGLHSQLEVHDWELSKSTLTRAAPPDLKILLSKLPVEERAVVHLVYASGCSHRETADVMKVACDYVDVMLRAVRASAKPYYGVTSAHSHRIDWDNRSARVSVLFPFPTYLPIVAYQLDSDRAHRQTSQSVVP